MSKAGQQWRKAFIAVLFSSFNEEILPSSVKTDHHSAASTPQPPLFTSSGRHALLICSKIRFVSYPKTLGRWRTCQSDDFSELIASQGFLLVQRVMLNVCQHPTAILNAPQLSLALAKASQKWRKAFSAVLCSSFNEEMSSSEKKTDHAAATTAVVLQVSGNFLFLLQPNPDWLPLLSQCTPVLFRPAESDSDWTFSRLIGKNSSLEISAVQLPRRAKRQILQEAHP